MSTITTALPTAASMREALLELWERTGQRGLGRLAAGHPPFSDEERVLEGEEFADWLSTCLMHAFKETGDPQVFALLFELNSNAFLQTIQARVRRFSSAVEPHDVLQEVFFNIYRYPNRFQAEKADSFRNWAYRIVRNTMLKAMKGATRNARITSLDDEMAPAVEARTRSPERSASEAESARIVNRAYVLYLNLYLIHFQKLSAKERRALTMVEVEGASYKQAAAELGIRLENLKMVIFRGRRKIYRGLDRTLEDMGARLRPRTARSRIGVPR